MDRGPKFSALLKEDSTETELDRGNFVDAVFFRSLCRNKGHDNSTLSRSE
jgi:hypothetical protein